MRDFDLAELYGSEEKGNRRALISSCLFLIMSIPMLLLAIFVNMDVISKIAMIYGVVVFVASAYFSFCSYFFTNGTRKDRCRGGKYIAFVSSLVIILFVFSPVMLVIFVSKKIKFESFVAHFEKYVIATFIPFLLAAITGLILYVKLQDATHLNSATVSMLFAFVLWRAISVGILKLYSVLGKEKFSKETYLSIKKDLYVMVFAMITLVTIIANCFKFDALSEDLVNGITKAFAIYIAFDRLYGKWKGINSDFEKAREKLKEEKALAGLEK